MGKNAVDMFPVTREPLKMGELLSIPFSQATWRQSVCCQKNNVIKKEILR
jgi:hypothetical protein